MGRKSKELKLVDDLLRNEEVVPNKTKPTIDFIDEKAYIEKGRPTGFTTARIAKFRRGTPEYLEVFKEYLVAAYKFSAFAKHTGYPFIGNEREWKIVKQEIDEWRSFYKLSEGDFIRILNICWCEDYKKSKLAALVKFNGIKIPPIDYQYKYLEPEEDEEPTVEDMVKEILQPVKKEKITTADPINGCPIHINYKGLRLNRNGCKHCSELYMANKERGVKENRNA